MPKETNVKKTAPVHRRRPKAKTTEAAPRTQSKPVVKPPTKKTQRKPAEDKSKIRIIPLGGLGEVGKNMTVIEYKEKMIIIDCGMTFPDDDMLGIDYVIPDTTFLEQNREKLLAILELISVED